MEVLQIKCLIQSEYNLRGFKTFDCSRLQLPLRNEPNAFGRLTPDKKNGIVYEPKILRD